MDIQAEARGAGILPDYYDAHGHHQHVPLDALKRVLDALPKPNADQLAEPIVQRIGGGPLRINLPALEPGVRWKLRNGGRVVHEGTVAGSNVDLPELPAGVYRLDVRDDNGAICLSTPLLVAPPTAFQGEFDRVWVLAVQLYSLRSDRNWGIGDFNDLKTLLGVASVLGCAGIGLNPLHALFDDQPDNCSPYAPNSRLFLNPVYIDVTVLPEFSGIDVATRDAIVREKQNALIDYAAVWAWKLTALQLAFTRFKADRTGERWKQFDDFRQQRGAVLRRFAFFEAMRKQFRRPWWEWPQDCQRPDDELMIDHRLRTGRDETEFVEYLQWIAHVQLQDCTDFAAAKGMKVGLYLDVAVGVRADGFDAWLEQGAISRELSVGAPPDLLNTAGQDWGLAGFNGIGLAARDFEPFRVMVEASASYAGAIRLDHVMGLARLFLVPSGFSPRDGAYVAMPLDSLLAVTALESQARRCIIIGEDLGTVPEGFREKLREWGVWSYQVMLFEREHDGRFKSVDQFTSQALVTFNTHDLPSYSGWREEHDLRVKRDIGVDPGESDDDRRHAVAALDRALAEAGQHGTDLTDVARFLCRTPSRILSVSLDDIVGVVEQINVPGTVDSHPNWRRRLPIRMDALDQLDRLRLVASALVERTAAGEDARG